MKQENPLLSGTASLTEHQKLQLFAIEELETRLEMLGNVAGVAAGAGIGGAKADEQDNGCWDIHC